MRTKRPSSDALYVHIPFCSHLCHYCDFTKRVYDAKTASLYVDRLIQEIASYHVGKVSTIYVGGGTPTSLNPEQLTQLLSYLHPYLKRNGEFTLEANIENVTLEKLRLMKEHGVNRLSLGIQTFSDAMLEKLNRRHSAQDAKNVVTMAQSVGLTNLSVDLMYGLPGMTLDDVAKDLNEVLSLNVDHVSCYALSVVPGTLFYRHQIPEATQEASRDQYDLILKTLRDHGYERYEVSNFARSGHYARHNLVYWNDRPYYGTGLGASGYLGGIRYTNTTSMSDYLAGHYRKEQEPIDPQTDENDFLMLKLRLAQGFTFQEFKERFQAGFMEKYADEAGDLLKRGLLIKDETHIAVSDDGMMLLDYVLLKLFKR